MVHHEEFRRRLDSLSLDTMYRPPARVFPLQRKPLLNVRQGNLNADPLIGQDRPAASGHGDRLTLLPVSVGDAGIGVEADPGGESRMVSPVMSQQAGLNLSTQIVCRADPEVFGRGPLYGLLERFR